MDCEYELRELQLKQLEILDELKRVCNKHGLTFFLAYGSCLGALRHQGFIPWDDDIDVIMPVADYDKLMCLASEFSEGFFLQNTDTDPNFLCAIARVRMNGTACIEEMDMDLECHQGIFLDIYPQYQYPNQLFSRIKIIYSSLAYRMLLANRAPLNHGQLVKLLGKVILRFLSIGGRENRIKRYRSNLRKYKNTEYVADLYGMDLTLTRVIKYKASWFSEPQWVSFEGREMPVPTNADAFLTERYGDYMKLPSEENRKSYHKYAYVDFNNEYKNVKE